MWGVLVLVLTVVGACCYLAACIWLIRLYLAAPAGHQDSDGFHLGEPAQSSDSHSGPRPDRASILCQFAMLDKVKSAGDEEESERQEAPGSDRSRV